MMSKKHTVSKVFLIVLFFLLFGTAQASGSDFINVSTQTVYPLYLNGMKVVLTAEEATLYDDGPVWSIIPQSYVYRSRKNISASHTQNNIFSDLPKFANTNSENNFLGINPALIQLARELRDPLSRIFFGDNSDPGAELADPDPDLVYVSLSSVLISNIVRYVSNERVDLVLLTDEKSLDQIYIKGVEIAMRLNPLYGMRLGLVDNNDMAEYRMQLEFYPNPDTAIKLLYSDNASENQTGLEFKYQFK